MQLRGLSCGSFLWKTTGLAPIGSACWSNILSAKVALRFSKGKGKKYRGSGMPHYGVKDLFWKSLKIHQGSWGLWFQNQAPGVRWLKPPAYRTPFCGSLHLCIFLGRRVMTVTRSWECFMFQLIHDFQCSGRHRKTYCIERNWKTKYTLLYDLLRQQPWFSLLYRTIAPFTFKGVLPWMSSLFITLVPGCWPKVPTPLCNSATPAFYQYICLMGLSTHPGSRLFG